MNIDFQKNRDGLVPAIVQDASTEKVLMLGYINAAALEHTQSTNKVTFYSRTRQRLWTKGETSGNFLDVEEIIGDCDSDTVLIKATPNGPVCHTGSDTCFGEKNKSSEFLYGLEAVINDRRSAPVPGSYTSKLFADGLNRIAQKVGEEAVELIIEAKDTDDERFRSEAADLLYHLLVLFAAKDIKLKDVIQTLKARSAIHPRDGE